jgi:hypothetical protein
MHAAKAKLANEARIPEVNGFPLVNRSRKQVKLDVLLADCTRSIYPSVEVTPFRPQMWNLPNRRPLSDTGLRPKSRNAPARSFKVLTTPADEELRNGAPPPRFYHDDSLST